MHFYETLIFHLMLLGDFDFCSVPFPSDRLTIKDLRTRFSHLFDKGLHYGDDAQPQFLLDRRRKANEAQGIGNTLRAERALYFSEITKQRTGHTAVNQAILGLNQAYPLAL